MKQPYINLLFSSERRKDLIFLLKKEPGEIDTIKKQLKINASSIHLHIKKMKDYGLINERNKVFSLSKKGETIVANMEPLLNTAEVFEQNVEYWKNHDLTSIPDFLLERIDELGHFELLEPETEYPVKTPKMLLENILTSRKVMTFVSYFHPEAPLIYAKLEEKGAEVTLCMTLSVAKRSFSGYRDETKRLHRAGNSKLFILRKEARIPSLIVTDRFLAFKLLGTDGKLWDQIVMCFGETALLWGESLISHIISSAEFIPDEKALKNALFDSTV
jgi:predicted transcriptional regulator